MIGPLPVAAGSSLPACQRNADDGNAVRVGRALARLSRVIDQASGSAGLSMAQYRVLVFVSARPERASALATKVDVQRATLSAIVGGLERAGLLRRVAVEHDGRGVQLEVTAAGRKALAQTEEELGRYLSGVAGVGGVDMAALAGHLEGLLAGLEQEWAAEDRSR